MINFNVVDKTFVKSKNSVKGIYLNYTYALTIFLIFTILGYILIGSNSKIISLVKVLSESLIITFIISYIINILTEKKKVIELFTDNHIHLIALIIGLLAWDTNILVLVVAITISLVVRKIYIGANLSASLYGLLVILLYKYFTHDYELFNLLNLSYDDLVINKNNIINYINPILSIISFIFLFYKKSIKYNIYIAYILSYVFMMLAYSLFHDGNIVFFISNIIINNIFFLSTYTLTDYGVSPTISETCTIYGLILSIISFILTFIFPLLGVIFPLIIGPIIFTKLLDKFSYKFKYEKNVYNNTILILVLLMILLIFLFIKIF